MLKRIVITGIVSSLFAKGLKAWTRRAAARTQEQELDVQRWEDEGGHAAAADAVDRAGPHASELRA